MIGTVTCNVRSFFGIDQPVFGEDAGRGAELADFATDAENPSRDPKLAIAGVDPEARVLDES